MPPAPRRIASEPLRTCVIRDLLNRQLLISEGHAPAGCYVFEVRLLFGDLGGFESRKESLLNNVKLGTATLIIAQIHDR